MALKYAILVTGSPYTSQAHSSAQRFVDACYRQGHSVHSVFFYGDAVYVANELWNPANDEQNLQQGWSSLASQYDLTINACVSVANKRGIVSQEDAELAGLPDHNVNADFHIAGLGEWVEASSHSDRVIHFS
ncbi:sulfurtransferase complex subunit TusD [Pleionea sediminis]|uniref:sulfurtransferase complex subunit TusD n=1 Tax=Pleionea sediminis TaxID=2569479 RepID=UPI001185530C|nr:sulfurtransferase complex subunit TusD [Pleionea sediminis]